MKKHFYGIGKKFWLYASLLLVLSALLTIGGISIVIMTSEKARIREQYVSKTEYVYDMFDSAYENLDTLTADLITNSYVQKSITDKELSGYDYEMIQRALSYLNSEYIAYYYYFDNQDKIYTQGKAELEKEEVINSEIGGYMSGSYAKTTLMYLDTSMIGGEGERFVVGRYIHHLNQNRAPGIVLLVLKSSFFSDVVEKATDTHSYFFIADADGSVCQWAGEGANEWQKVVEDGLDEYLEANQGQESFVIEFVDGMICGKWHEASGFYLLTFVPKSALMQMQYKIIAVVLFVAVGVLAASALVAGYFSRYLSKPIQEISENMIHFDMDSLKIPLYIDTNTELDDISNSYNMMLQQIDHLLEKIKLQQEEMKNMEMEALMYQVHPHFLYNTLGNIYMLARMNGEETMMRMIDSLSTFLRLTLNNGEDVIIVSEELEHVCAYMEILRIRNSDMFCYEIDCDEDCKEFRILKLVLQPLAENAIKHGFANYDEGGLIKISVKREEGKVHISIYDNGEGMTTEALERINQIEQEEATTPEEGTRKGIGVRNVVHRLKLKYGKGVSFWYESQKGNTTGHIVVEEECLQKGK